MEKKKTGDMGKRAGAESGSREGKDKQEILIKGGGKPAGFCAITEGEGNGIQGKEKRGEHGEGGKKGNREGESPCGPPNRQAPFFRAAEKRKFGSKRNCWGFPGEKRGESEDQAVNKRKK